MASRSFRTTEAQDRFIEETDVEVSKLAREGVENERIRRAAGVCACCGTIIYTGSSDGFAVIHGGSPAGKELGLGNEQDVDLCDDHYQQTMDAFTEADVQPPSFAHFARVHPSDHGEGYRHYNAERHAVANAMPGDDATILITDRERLLTRVDVPTGEHAPDAPAVETLFEALIEEVGEEEARRIYGASNEPWTGTIET